jgi:hypothetical protein
MLHNVQIQIHISKDGDSEYRACTIDSLFNG